MKVSLVDHTGFGHGPLFAAAMLIFAKSTRTHMSGEGFQEVWNRCQLDEEWMNSELSYIANTIPGSWEFVDYTFLIEGVTRSFTHQLVRTRTASYAQQSMQINDHSGFDYRVGPSLGLKPQLRTMAESHMDMTNDLYKLMLEEGVKSMDARELLPTGIHTNIMMKANLRTFIDLIHTRLSPRNAGEFVDVARAMREEILRVHSWATFFLERTVDKAMEELDEMLKALPGDDVTSDKYKMLKLVDQIRRKS